MRKAPSATTHGVLVQLVRMPACHAGGHEFESRTHRFHIATNGALVQLVRMPACHAGGHEFESRTHRKKHPQKGCFFVLYIVYQLGKQLGSPDKPGGLSIQLCKSEKKEFYIRYSS